MDHSPDRMCTGKACHASKATARTAANAMRRRIGGRWAAYCCPYCDNWHIGVTSLAQARGRRIERRLAA